MARIRRRKRLRSTAVPPDARTHIPSLLGLSSERAAAHTVIPSIRDLVPVRWTRRKSRADEMEARAKYRPRALRGKLRAALGAARLEDRPACPGLHARTESVLALPTPVV